MVEKIKDNLLIRKPAAGVRRIRKDAWTMYVVCKDHVELAIDMFVDEFEEAPDVVDLEHTKFIDWEPPVKCQECDHEARFLVV